jgi:hypothetical protein
MKNKMKHMANVFVAVIAMQLSSSRLQQQKGTKLPLV